MDPRYYNQWPGQAPSGTRRFYPAAGSFSDVAPRPIRQQAQSHQQVFSGPVQNQQFVSPQQLYQPRPTPLRAPEVQPPQLPFPTAGFQDSLNRAYAASGPVVHEGYIPAPGQEVEDYAPYPNLPAQFQDSLFQSYLDSSDDDSDTERRRDAEHERLLEAADRDDVEADADYSTDDADQDAGDPEEMDLVEEFNDEEEEEARPRPKPGKPSARGFRGGRRGRPPGRGRGGFGRSASRGGRPGKPGRPKGRRGPRPVADPGPQFKDLQRLANEAYMRGDFATALEYGQKAVQLNPEIFNAHNLVSEIYEAMGDEQRSLEALIIGAPTKRDPGLWTLIIERINKVDPHQYPMFTEDAKVAMILGCLKSLILLDPLNYEARSHKLEIESGLGHVSRCVKLCRKMLTIRPGDAEVLRVMAMMGTSSNKQTTIHLKKMIESFEKSIDYYLKNDHDPSTSRLDWELLNIYLDLLDRDGDYDYALLRLKTLARWKQKRFGETYWDNEEDDREFDIEDIPRRITVPQFVRASKGAKYGKTLPMEIRVKMGLFRLRLGPSHYQEAMHHLEMLDPDDHSLDGLFWDYEDLFCLIADALHATGHDKDALRFYEPLYNNESKELGLMSYIGLHTCYTHSEESEKANEIIPILTKWHAETLDDLAILATFFEDQGMRTEAMERGAAVYRNGGAYKLRKLGFKGYEELKEYFFQQRKQARGNHTVKKTKARKYRTLLQKATRAGSGDANGDNSDNEGENHLPSLGPLSRPTQGLFRTKKLLPSTKPQTFLPIGAEQGPPESSTFEGTNVPIEAIDHSVFRRKLEKLATDFAEDLEAARAQHREIAASFKRLEELSDLAEAGDATAMNEVMSVTRELIEEFSTFDLFYSDRREDFQGYFRRVGSGELWKESALMTLAVVANNVEDGETEVELKERPDTSPDTFWGIHFDKWCDAFGRYAILLAREGDDEGCFSTLDVATQSNIFSRSQTYHQQLQLSRLVCALEVDDSKQASLAVRWLLRNYPFGSDIFRLYSCVNRLCSFPEGFATGPAYKVLMRYIKTMDYVLLTPEQRVWYNFKGKDQTSWMQNSYSTEITTFVKDHDPALFGLFAHVLMCGGTYVAALNYYFRAYAITPDDPILNLSIGTAYIQHAMKRLSENRQFQIQQGLAFISRYYDLRTNDKVAIHCQEAEFNVGRIWHSLGLVSQAIPAYERCIAWSKHVQVDAHVHGEGSAEDFATEAAFAIQHIYAITGNFEGAKKVTEESLVIE